MSARHGDAARDGADMRRVPVLALLAVVDRLKPEFAAPAIVERDPPVIERELCRALEPSVEVDKQAGVQGAVSGAGPGADGWVGMVASDRGAGGLFGRGIHRSDDTAIIEDLARTWERLQRVWQPRVDRMRYEATTVGCRCAGGGGESLSDGRRCSRCHGQVGAR